jgi:hypothetical protein
MSQRKLLLKQLNFHWVIQFGSSFSMSFVAFSMSRTGLKEVVAYLKDKRCY